MFWVYENWVAEKKAVVHRAECGYCQNGQGSHPTSMAIGMSVGTGPSLTMPQRERLRRRAPSAMDSTNVAERGYHRIMGYPAIDIDSMAPEDRLRLIGELWDSLQHTPDSIPISDAHREELDARLDAIERGEAEVVEWDEALRRMRK